jgi:hypothetical protein
MEKMGLKCLMRVFEWAKNEVLISKRGASFAMPMRQREKIALNRGTGNIQWILFEETR